MTRRTAGWIGGGVAGFCCLSQVVSAWLLYHSPEGWDYFSLLLLGFPTVGAVIVSQQPRNTIGWILVVCSASIFLGFLFAAMIYATIDTEPLFWQQLLAWITNIIFIGGVEAVLVTLAYLFPTGRTLSPRWRAAGCGVGVILVVNYLLLAVQPGPLNGYFADLPQLTNPFGVAAVEGVIDALRVIFVPLGVAVVLTSLAAIVVRVRRAGGVERLQLQWIALALGGVGLGIVMTALVEVLSPADATWLNAAADVIFFSSATLGVSAAIGIAILRYHLYDIGRIVNRTIVYLSLTVALALVYVVLTLLLGAAMRALTGTSGSIVTAAATLVSAALFNPLRLRIQRVVDRRFYRRKYDAGRLIADFSYRVRDEIDLSTLETELRQIVIQTMQPAHVSVWLRPVVPPERVG